MYYSEKEEYKGSDIATSRQNMLEHGGVSGAVKDFLSQNPEWDIVGFESMEPVILFRKDIYDFQAKYPPDWKVGDFCTLANVSLIFEEKNL